tara:strand:+ start:417 stop:941 length:525 start_codon:yes stop_codon:yes gene_type:complete
MACNTLTTGRSLPCKTGFGGVKVVYFAEYGTLGTTTIDADGTVSAFSGSPVWFQYDVKGNSSLETAITSSRENGTTFYAQTLNLTLTYLDNATQQEIQILAVSRPHLVVEDYLGNQFLCGYENGVECTGGTVVTGAAAGDLSGFTLTFEGQEETAPYFIDTGVVSASATQITPN